VSLLLKNFTFAALALVLALAPSASLLAQQEVKPVVVVAVAPIEKQIADANYLAELVGQREAAGGILGFAPVFLNGIDMKRPAGGFVLPGEDGDFRFVAFVPVTRLETVLRTFEEQIGKPRDVGDGILEFETAGQSVYLKETKGWAYLSNDTESLANVPADPLPLLGDLATKYNLAFRANVHDIPAELRQTAVDAIQSGLERGLEEGPGAGPDRELAERMSRMSAQQFTRLIEEVDQFTIGWGVDKAEKATYIDFTVTAIEGSAMARQMAALKDTKSRFTGFLMPGASVTLNSASKLGKDDIEQNVALLEMVRKRAESEIDNDAGLGPNQRASAKQIVGQFFTVLTDTVKQGTLDLGATLMLEEEKLSFAGGVHVADGRKLEEAFAKLVDLAKNEPDFPDVKLNAAKHGDVNLHTVEVDIPEGEEEARRLFGERLNITVGTAPTALYAAFGKDGQDLMKRAIDASKQAGDKAVPPMQLNLFLRPIILFAASMDRDGNPVLQDIARSLEEAEGGEDQISLTSTAIPNGSLTRLNVTEGVLRLIGEAAAAGQRR
jgi:hypothetical protein